MKVLKQLHSISILIFYTAKLQTARSDLHSLRFVMSDSLTPCFLLLFICSKQIYQGHAGCIPAVPKLHRASASPGGATLRNSHSEAWMRIEICPSSKFPGDADAAGLGPQFRNPPCTVAAVSSGEIWWSFRFFSGLAL